MRPGNGFGYQIQHPIWELDCPWVGWADSYQEAMAWFYSPEQCDAGPYFGWSSEDFV